MTNKPLPEYICTGCAEKLKPEKHKDNIGFTLHQNICPLCEQEGMVATLRDFGLKPNNNENWD
jgi:hypothetical protein